LFYGNKLNSLFIDGANVKLNNIEDESQVEKEARSSFKEKAKKDESEIEVNDSPLSISVSRVTAPR
jgi:hypothetical protein